MIVFTWILLHWIQMPFSSLHKLADLGDNLSLKQRSTSNLQQKVLQIEHYEEAAWKHAGNEWQQLVYKNVA